MPKPNCRITWYEAHFGCHIGFFDSFAEAYTNVMQTKSRLLDGTGAEVWRVKYSGTATALLNAHHAPPRDFGERRTLAFKRGISTYTDSAAKEHKS